MKDAGTAFFVRLYSCNCFMDFKMKSFSLGLGCGTWRVILADLVFQQVTETTCNLTASQTHFL